MIKDSEIKAQVSPFAIREGEIKTFDGKDGYVSMNQIVHKINIGHITDIHFAILEIVNEFEFITSRQIYQLLELKGIDPQSQDKLNNKLESLVKSKILTRYYFTSDEGKGVYRIYCLEKMGKHLLTSKEIECKWQQSDNTKPVAMIKKRLAGNQILIAYKTKVKAFTSYTVKPVITAKQLAKTIKANGGVKLTKSNKSIDFIFEVVRREDDWQKKFVDKMKLYADFYENYVMGDSGYSSMPQLILVGEDDKHLAEMFKDKHIFYDGIYDSISETIHNAVAEAGEGATVKQVIAKTLHLPEWIAALFVLSSQSEVVTPIMESELSLKVTMLLLKLIAFGILFVGMILVMIILKIIAKALRENKFVKVVDGIFGMALYLFIYLLIISVFFFVLDILVEKEVVSSTTGFIAEDLQLGTENFSMSRWLLKGNLISSIRQVFVK